MIRRRRRMKRHIVLSTNRAREELLMRIPVRRSITRDAPAAVHAPVAESESKTVGMTGGGGGLSFGLLPLVGALDEIIAILADHGGELRWEVEVRNGGKEEEEREGSAPFAQSAKQRQCAPSLRTHNRHTRCARRSTRRGRRRRPSRGTKRRREPGGSRCDRDRGLEESKVSRWLCRKEKGERRTETRPVTDGKLGTAKGEEGGSVLVELRKVQGRRTGKRCCRGYLRKVKRSATRWKGERDRTNKE